MGCASSKVLEYEEGAHPRLSRGISLPAHQQDRADAFHIVALTSSTYGILKLDPPNPSEDESKDGDPVKEMLRKLSNLESGAETAPQSWHEVSTMVGNLKPGLDKIYSVKQPIASRPITSQQAEKPVAINIEEVIGEKDDGSVQFSSQTKVSTATTRKPKPFDQSLRIRTLEELDSRLGRSQSLNPSALNSTKAVVARFNSVADRSTSTATSVPKTSSTTTNSDRANNVRSNVDKADTKASTMNMNNSRDVPTDCSKHGNAVSQPVPAEQQAVKSEAGTPVPAKVVDQKVSPTYLEKFGEICPPGGAKSVVLYTTSLRGIRKTYESCNTVRGIVQSYGVLIDERDVSLHLEFRNELRELMEKVVTVPRLFIKGRYIGGAEEVSKLHEEEKLGELLELLPKEESTGLCDGCGGSRFLPCFDCSGSCKLVDAGNLVSRCRECNENGLIRCPLCS